MADFEADKTSGTGPALVMVHPLKVNDTEADKRRLRNIRHDNKQDMDSLYWANKKKFKK